MSVETESRPGSQRRDPNERGNSPRAQNRRMRFSRRTAASDAMIISAWASGAIAVALFLAAGGPRQFGSLAATVTSLGIVAGLVGTDMVLLMLVLAARIPLIDRTVGHDRAMALHRTLGKPALYLLLGHGFLILVGYAAAARVNPIAEVVSIWNLPDMPLAFVSIGLFVLVVVTSVVTVRRRFAYEFWHVIHLLSYFAVIFALPHQLSEGGVLAEGTAQRVYWIALYVVALGSIAVFRFGEPLVKSLRHDIRVSRVEAVGADVISLHLTGRHLESLKSAGGQFFVWRFWSGATWWHSHPISLSSVPRGTEVRVTVRSLGDGSRSLGMLLPGTRVWIEGPYGLFTDAARTAPKLAIVAAGIGITPVRALLEDSHLDPGEATILLRAGGENDRFLWDEMQQLADRSGARLYTMVGPRPTQVETWMSERDVGRGVSMRSVFPELAASDLYVCGPQAWTDLVVEDARDAGIPAHQIHTERFDW
jgi:predicted ferric reductase